jgi:hypothetical protein
MTINYVCTDHPDTVLANVRQIRSDIWRPQGINVVGECEECRKPHVFKGRYGSKIVSPSVLSYGRRSTLTLLRAKAE